MQTRLFLGTAALGVGLIIGSGYGHAQGVDVGKQEYMNSCASCHGENGKGYGPITGSLKQLPADLTVLAKKSAGVFPFARVYDVIDGRQAIAAHGPRDMPVWGDKYWEEGQERSGGAATSAEIRSFAQGRIIALIGYIYTLQEK